SLHMVLPDAAARTAIDAGWAEQHPVARRGLIPAGSVMVYAPRNDDEAEVVASLVRASYEYACGDVQH
ncbi:phospholipase, partial [Pseudarthrobacter phenanthrenivorans]